MITALELATLDACRAFHASQFGAALRERSPQTRHAESDLFGDPLLRYEINGGAPIARTFKVLHMMQMTQEPIDASGIQDYLAWIAGALRVVQRLAQMCWAPIGKQHRRLIYDEDDLGPAGSPYMPASRHDELSPALEFEGLAGSAAIDAWRGMVAVLRQTPCFLAAKAAGEALREPRVRREAEACRAATDAELEAMHEQGPLQLGESLDRRRALIRSTYDRCSPELRQAASAIRAHNQLVNHLLWAVMCAAESSHNGPSIVADLSDRHRGAIRLTGRRPQYISLVSDIDGWVGHPPSPFTIATAAPYAGVYIMRGTMMQFVTSTLIDIKGTRLASLEQGAPPE